MLWTLARVLLRQLVDPFAQKLRVIVYVHNAVCCLASIVHAIQALLEKPPVLPLQVLVELLGLRVCIPIARLGVVRLNDVHLIFYCAKECVMEFWEAEVSELGDQSLHHGCAESAHCILAATNARFEWYRSPLYLWPKPFSPLVPPQFGAGAVLKTSL